MRDVLLASGLPGAALTLEMTESVLMERTDEVVELLRRIKTLGVRVAVDDFGTGYSSLSYLSRFPVDILKVDKSFVAQVDKEDGRGELVRTIVRLGESLRLETVAEGIETPGQRAALEAMGCTFGQGFLFARPMPADELDELLWRPRPTSLSSSPDPRSRTRLPVRRALPTRPTHRRGMRSISQRSRRHRGGQAVAAAALASGTW